MIIKAIVDCETGGLNPFLHSLLSVGVVPVDDQFNRLGHIKSVTFKMYDPNYQVEKQALEINKLWKYLEHPTYKQAFLSLFEWASLNKITGIEPIGHNFAIFDHPFLRLWLGDEVKFFKRQVRDTKIVAEFLKDCNLLTGGISLKDLCSSFGINHLNDHDAENDCESTRLLLQEMIKRFGNHDKKPTDW